MKARIIGSGSYIPPKKQGNCDFEQHEFYEADGTLITTPLPVIIRKFKAITGISERRYANPDLQASDLATIAAKQAIADANIDPETIDYIILAHNFGNVNPHSNQGDAVPSLAARVKHTLGINNPRCVAYDLLFGCPGWVEGSIQAQAFIQSGLAKRCLVIGTETLSRVVDPHDRDSMIYADGAGAVIWEASTDESGILSHGSLSYTKEEAYFIFFGKSNKPGKPEQDRFIKMYGRKIYEFALTHVPQAISETLEKANIPLEKVAKILIHQANEKMDEAIVDRLYKSHNLTAPERIMPMSIGQLGNSSVATVPTLYDLIKKGELPEHELKSGDVIIFASVGAGMNINAIVYRC